MTTQVYKRYLNDPSAGGFTVGPGDTVSTVVGATAGSPSAVYNLRAGYSLTAYPTAAGTAVVKMSTSPLASCIADVAANNFSTGLAKWVDWTTGSITALGQEYTLGAMTAVAIVATTGSWVLEVCG
jgi:hypothetical protein